MSSNRYDPTPPQSWIEPTYHRRRRQRVLGCLTPVKLEILETELQAAWLVPCEGEVIVLVVSP